MKKLSFAALLLMAASLAAQAPVSAVAYTRVISPTDADFASLNPAPSFAPIAHVFVIVVNAMPGVKYSFTVTAAGQGSNTYTASGATNGITNQANVEMDLQPGDSLASAPVVVVTGSFPATSTVVN